MHGENQRLFGFGERGTAKIFVFKLLYGALEYGFANDPEMNFISSSPKYWKKIINKYYEKYVGIATWHEKIIKEVGDTGMYTSPFGRSYKWDLMKYGSFKIPTTQVKNYPVQGLGADIVSIARVSLYKRWRGLYGTTNAIRGVLVNTIHDSIVADVDNRDVDKTINLLYTVFADLPGNINRIFNCKFDLETRVEVLVGKDMHNLKEMK